MASKARLDLLGAMEWVVNDPDQFLGRTTLLDVGHFKNGFGYGVRSIKGDEEACFKRFATVEERLLRELPGNSRNPLVRGYLAGYSDGDAWALFKRIVLEEISKGGRGEWGEGAAQVAKGEEGSFGEILSILKERSGLFFTQPSIACLKSFLGGVILALDGRVDGALGFKQDSFEHWLSRAENLEGVCRWDRLILAGSECHDFTAYYRFFEKWEEFEALNGGE